MTRVWVTGGAGMVGRHVVPLLAARGHEVFAPRRAECDLLDSSAVRAWLAEVRPQVIVHAAGKVGGIAANVRDPIGFFMENLEMGTLLVRAAHEAGVPRLINLGSSCMYPRDHATPLREEDLLTGALEPTNEGYALAKIAVARLCAYARSQWGRALYKTLIPCNLYGPGDDFGAESGHLVASALRKAHEAKLAGSASIEVWGDGTARREFLYVGDLAQAILMAVERLEEVPDDVNVGVGEDATVREYYQAALNAVGLRAELVYDTSMPVGMRRKLLDVSRMTSFGFRPRTSLHDGLAATYRAYLEDLRV